jgi:hypothetical protein
VSVVYFSSSQRSKSSPVELRHDAKNLVYSDLFVFNAVWSCWWIPTFQFEFWRWKQYVSPKLWYLLTSIHGITSQKNNSEIFTAGRPSNQIIEASITIANLSLESIPNHPNAKHGCQLHKREAWSWNMTQPPRDVFWFPGFKIHTHRNKE